MGGSYSCKNQWNLFAQGFIEGLYVDTCPDLTFRPLIVFYKDELEKKVSRTDYLKVSFSSEEKQKLTLEDAHRGEGEAFYKSCFAIHSDDSGQTDIKITKVPADRTLKLCDFRIQSHLHDKLFYAYSDGKKVFFEFEKWAGSFDVMTLKTRDPKSHENSPPYVGSQLTVAGKVLEFTDCIDTMKKMATLNSNYGMARKLKILNLTRLDSEYLCFCLKGVIFDLKSRRWTVIDGRDYSTYITIGSNRRPSYRKNKCDANTHGVLFDSTKAYDSCMCKIMWHTNNPERVFFVIFPISSCSSSLCEPEDVWLRNPEVIILALDDGHIKRLTQTSDKKQFVWEPMLSRVIKLSSMTTMSQDEFDALLLQTKEGSKEEPITHALFDSKTLSS